MNRSAKIALGIGAVALVGALTWGGAFQGRIVNVNRAVRQAANPSISVQNVRAPVDAARNAGAAIQQQAANAAQQRAASYAQIAADAVSHSTPPTLALVAHGGDQAQSGILQNGTNTLLAFNITAPAQEDIGIKKMTFFISSVGVGQYSNFRLFAGQADITNQVKMYSSFGYDLVGFAGGGDFEIFALWPTELRVPRGTALTVRLQADAENVQADSSITAGLSIDEQSSSTPTNSGRLLFCGANACIVNDPSHRIDLDAYLSIVLPDFNVNPGARANDRSLALRIDDIDVSDYSLRDIRGPLSFVDPNPNDNYDAVVYFDANLNGRYEKGTELGLMVDAQNQAQQGSMTRWNGPIPGQIMYADQDTRERYDETTYIDTDYDFHYNPRNDIRLVQAAGNNLSGFADRSYFIRPRNSNFVWSNIFSPSHSSNTVDWRNGGSIPSLNNLRKTLQ